MSERDQISKIEQLEAEKKELLDICHNDPCPVCNDSSWENYREQIHCPRCYRLSEIEHGIIPFIADKSY